MSLFSLLCHISVTWQTNHGQLSKKAYRNSVLTRKLSAPIWFHIIAY